MKELLIESKGIRTSQYFIQPFELRVGELVIIYVESSRHFEDIELQLANIFAGTKKNENVNIIKPLTFAKPIKESRLKRIFNPISVGRFLKRNADLNSSVMSRFFAIDTYTKKDKIKSLDTSQRKRLSLCAVFSKTRNIVFDMRGEGAIQFRKTYEFVKEEIKNDGAAILIDWTDELRNDCSKFIAIEWTVDFEEVVNTL